MEFTLFLKKYATQTNKSFDSLKFENHSTSKGDIPFLQIGSCFITIGKFEYLPSDFFELISELEIIELKNKLYLVFAESKDEANRFCKHYFDIDCANKKESRYALVIREGTPYVFLNYAPLKKGDLRFLLTQLDSQVSSLPSKELREKTAEIYLHIVENYVISAGYKKPQFNEQDVDLVQRFRDVLVNSISGEFAKQNLSNEYLVKSIDSTKRRIYLFQKGFFNDWIKKLHYFENFLSLTTTFLTWSIDITIAQKRDDEVETLISSLLAAANWGHYSDFKRPFLNYFEDLKKEILTCCSSKDILETYERNVLKLIQQIPKRIIRFNEALEISNRISSLVSFFQICGREETQKTRFEMDALLEETQQIILKNSDPIALFTIKQARAHLLEQFAIITQDSSVFESAYQEALTFAEFIEEHYDSMKLIAPKGPKVDDIIFAFNAVGQLCFCMQQFEKFEENRKKIDQLMQKFEVSTFTKLMINQLNFTFEENYESLSEMYRLIRTYTSGEFNIPNDHGIRAGGKFAEAFFTEDIGLKSKLYAEARELNQNTPITLITLQKDVSQTARFDQFIQIFYHLEMCHSQDNPYLFVSELQTALKIAEENISEAYEFEFIWYLFLKTKIVHLFVSKKYVEIESELQKIKRFDFKQSKEFQKFIQLFLELTKLPYDGRILTLNTFKKTNDLWTRILIKFIQKSAMTEYLEVFQKTSEDFSQINDMSALLNKFKIIIQDGAVKSFWAKQGKLNSNAEDIGRSQLLIFLRALNKFELTRESEVNFFKMDLFVVDKKDATRAFIIETKIYRNNSNFEDGIAQISQKYLKYKEGLHKSLESHYVIFDDRLNCEKLPDVINTEKYKIRITQVPINKETS